MNRSTAALGRSLRDNASCAGYAPNRPAVMQGSAPTLCRFVVSSKKTGCVRLEQLSCTPVRACASVGAGLPANELAKELRAQSLPQT